jgi:S-adenosylmethionine synthetase
VLLGEVSVNAAQVNFEQVARDVAKGIGFDAEEKGLNGDTCDVI